jgi:phage-related protein
MASKAALQISIEGDSSDAVASFDAVTSSARGMGDTVDRASKQADDGASRLDGAADAADNMASRSSQAAGGLGDLGGALSQMGGPLGAVGTGMETLAPSIMGVTGAADLMNLAMSSNIVTNTKARAASIKTAVATKAQAVATRTMAIAQRVLNAAMRANPIGILITALLLAAAGVLLLWKRSETFRTVVRAVMSAAKTAVTGLINTVQSLVGWFRDKLGPVISRIREVASNVASGAVGSFKRIIEVVGNVIGKVGDAAAKVRDGFGATVTATKTTVVDAFNAMISPIKTMIEWVKDLIDWISKIKIPNVPGFGRAAVPAGGSFAADPGYGAGTQVTIELPLLSALDDRAIGQLLAALTEYYRRRGQAVQIVSA